MLARDRTEPRPHAQAAFGVGPGLIRRFIARSPRRSGHAPVCPSRRRSRRSSPPQVCPPPALTETKEPAGGVLWPKSSLPQQATEPSLLTPQVFFLPGADGDEGTRRRRGLACGITAPAGDGAIAPHLACVVPPALTETKEPREAWPRRINCRPSRRRSRRSLPRRCGPTRR